MCDRNSVENLPEYRVTATKGWDPKRGASDLADCSAPLLAQHGGPDRAGQLRIGIAYPLIDSC
jgi:hypothetical protein